MRLRMTFVAVLLALGLAFPASAQDVKFVGIWEGLSQPIYTKLVFHEDKSLTYCSVQNCRAVQCDKVAYTGSLQDRFEIVTDLREWTFEWTGSDEIEGLMSIRDGGMAFAIYGPESPGDRFDLLSLPDPLN